MTDEHRAYDAPGAEEPPASHADPDSPLVRLLALAEERPLTVEDFVAARDGGDLRP
jgi:hypothetical protein